METTLLFTTTCADRQSSENFRSEHKLNLNYIYYDGICFLLTYTPYLHVYII